MADRVLQVVNNQVRVSVSGGALIAALAAQAALPFAERAEEALAEIESIATGAPEAASIVTKLNRTGSNFADDAERAVFRTAAKVENTYINAKLRYALSGLNDFTDSAKMQAMLDEAELGATIFWEDGNYFTDGLHQARHLSHIFSPNATITGVGSNPAVSVFNIQLSEGIDDSGSHIIIDGMRVQVATSYDALAALNLESQVGVDVPLLGVDLRGFYLSTPDAATGVALRIAGESSQLHSIANGAIVNGIHLDGCADACAFHDIDASGIKTAAIVDVVAGAFKTMFTGGSYVSRDGAFWIKGGSQVILRDMTIEQADAYGDNANTYSASVIFDADSYSIRGSLIENVNFGGGPKVDRGLYVRTMDTGSVPVGETRTVADLRVRFCTWNVHAVEDINIADSRCKYIVIENNQMLRGERGGGGFSVTPEYTANTLDVRPLLTISDSGVGTSGVRKTAVALGGASTTALINSWTCAADVRFVKDEDEVHFESYAIAPGSTQTDVVIGTLPAGFQPAQQEAFTLAADVAGAAATARAIINTNGTIQVSCAASAVVYLSGIRFRAKQSGYDPAT